MKDGQVYDNRQLTLMMEELSAELREKKFVDTAKLIAGLGGLQGHSARDVSRAGSLTTPFVPGVKNVLTKETAAATEEVPTPGSSVKDETTTTSAELKPTPPAIPEIELGTSVTPSLGAVELLNDQLNLTYRLFNLRLLLERSLTARLLQSGEPRLQAVLDIPVSFEPSQVVAGAAAVVEVTFTAKAPAAPDGLSLVATMTQENAFNTSAVSRKSNAFGAAAVVKLVQVGYNQRSAENTYFIYRDSDTLTYERHSVDKNEVTVGWVVRPVLGRKSITTEDRHLFVVLALPHGDLPEDSSQNMISVKVDTRWKRNDASRAVTFGEDEANRRSRFLHWITGGLAKPEYFGNRLAESLTPYDLFVPTTHFYQKHLAPANVSIDWTVLGGKAAMLSIGGKNFFTGTRVALGDKIYGGADGLLIKDSQNMEMVVPLSALSTGDGAVLGRYGKSVPFYDKQKPPASSFTITKAEIAPSSGDQRPMDLYLNDSSGAPYAGIARLVTRSLITINGSPVPPPYGVVRILTQGTPREVIRVNVPSSTVAKAAEVRITEPFTGRSARITFEDTVNAYSVISIDEHAYLIRANDQLGFVDPKSLPTPGTPTPTPVPANPWKIHVDDQMIDFPAPGQSSPLPAPTPAPTPTARPTPAAGASPTPSPTAAPSVPPKPALERLSTHALLVRPTKLPSQVILVNSSGFPFVMEVPELKTKAAEKEKPKTEPELIVNQYDAVWLKISVKKSVSKVSAEKNELTIFPKDKPDATEIRVELTRALTDTARKLDLRIDYSDDTVEFKSVTINPAPEKAEKPK